MYRTKDKWKGKGKEGDREEKALLDNKLSRYVCKSQFSRLMDYFWFCLF